MISGRQLRRFVKRPWMLIGTSAIVLSLAIIIGLFDYYRMSPVKREIRRYSRSPSSDARMYGKLLRLANGDSLESVKLSLGSPMDDFLEKREEYRVEAVKVYRDFMTKNPARYPEGVEDRDTFEEFCCVSEGMIWLQFRDGRLVNFNAANYRDLIKNH